MELMKKNFRIQLQKKPITKHELCIEILTHFTNSRLKPKFLRKEEPIYFTLNEEVYKAELIRVAIRKKYCWVIDCSEI